MKTISSANAAAAASGMTPNVKAVLHPKTGSALALTGSDFFGTGMSFSSGTTPEETFEVGACVIGGLKFSLNNMQRRFSTFNFAGAYIDPELYYDDVSDTIPMGRFYFQMHRDLGDTIRCETFDALKLMDEQRASITFPATAAQIVQALATANDISVYSLNFNGASTTIQNPNTAMSQRQLLSYVMQLTGNYAIMRSDKKLHIEWYQANPTQVEMPIFDQQLSTADIEVTGVEVFPIDTPETAVDLGTEEYVVTVKDNPLITSSNSSAAANAVFSQVDGVRFRPGFIVGLANPAIEAGDMISFPDLNSNTIRFLVTNLRFQPSNLHETYQSDAEEFGSSDLRPNTAGRIRYTWYAYADDASGTNISLSPDGKDYIGIAPNRLTETPDITNPAVYTWSLIKGSTPVIDATKEGGTTTITADGEPIAEIEDGNGIASKTDYYMLADTMDSSALSEARSHLPHDMTGTVITISDAMGDIPFETVTVDIVPVQSGSGDPSPSNIRPISGWTGATVTRTGNNLLEPKVFTSGTGFTNPVKVDFSKYPSYTFSCNISTDICRTMIYGYSSKSDALGDVNKIARTAGTVENVRTISKDLFTYEVAGDVDSIEYIVVRFYGSRTTAQDLNNGEIQVEIGSSATAFEPYNGASYPVTWSEAGTVYGGTLDVINGTLAVTMAMVDLGTRNWSYNSNIGAFYSSLAGIIITGYTNAMKAPIVCNKYVTVAYYPDGAGYFGGNDKCVAFAFQSGQRLYVKDSAYTDVATFKAAMSGVQLVYELAEPVTYQLTPVEIETLLGQNNVWADAGDVSLTYYDDLAASWHDEPLEPNAYSKYLWWYYNTTYTDGRSVNSDPAIIGVYNQDWFEDTQKAQATADGALSTADAAVVDASKAQSAANEAAEAALAAQNAANAAIENITITAASLETLRTSAMQQLAELQAAIGEFRAWISFSSETSLVVGKQSASNNYVVQIEGDCISFYEAADVGDISKRVAYFQNHHLYTDNASIGQQLDIGNFSFIREADGGLSLVYTG